MARFSTIQNNFLAGELSPKLRTRMDVDEYKQGLSKLINMIPKAFGGVQYRAGTSYLATLTVAGTAEKLFSIPFTDESGNDYFISIDESNATAANRFKVYNTDGVLQSLDTTYGNALSILTSAVNSISIWGDYQGFRWAQKGSLMVITHVSGLMEPLIFFKKNGVFYLTSYRATTSIIPGLGNASIRFQRFPFLPENDGPITLSIDNAAAGTGRTLTASAALFSSSMVGHLIRIRHAGVEGVVAITAFTSTTVVTVEVLVALASTSATNFWKMDSWTAGWPRFVTIFEQRLIFASAAGSPDEIWQSAIGNFFLIMQDTLAQDSSTDVSGTNYFGAKDAADPFSFFPDNCGIIQWITAGQTLHVGSNRGEFSIDGSQGKYAFNSITVKNQTQYGGAPFGAVRVLNSTFYISQDGRRVREFVYSDENGSYINRDMTLLNDSLLEFAYDDTDFNARSLLRFRQMAWDANLNVLWIIIGGEANLDEIPMKLVGFSFDKSAGLKGWFRFDTGGRVKSIQSINKTVYMIVERVLNGSAVQCLEKLSHVPESDELYRENVFADDEPRYLDCCKRVNGSNLTTFTGFSHLANMEVSVLSEGQYIGEFTVTAGGNITIPIASDQIIAGFKYTGYLKTMNLEAGATIGNSQILFKKIDRAIAHLYKSKGGKYGFVDENLMDIEYPDFTGDLYTGDSTHIDFESSAGETQHMIIQKDDPSPFYLMGLSMRGLTEE